MNEISSLLIGIRQRAISAANVGASDKAMTAASQSEIENALSSLDRIVSSTQFGQHKLLDGTNARKTLEDGTSKEGLRFHVGPDAGHIASISIKNMTSSQLGRVAEGEMPNASNFMSLADIDVNTEQGSQDALTIIDEAITEVATVRGELGAFQTNTLESNLTSLQIAAENMTSAESTLRDTDMAQELATFTRNQIMSQSATAQLAQANALPQNVLRLLNN
jgi:flagellin